MPRALTPAEELAVGVVFKQVGPGPRGYTHCPKCGSDGLLLAYGAGLFGFCESACACGWSGREAMRDYALKLRAAVKPVLLGFNPPIEPSDNSDLE